jgi:hypothetical protein
MESLDGGPIALSAEGFKGEHAKDKFATAARLICIAHRATATVLASESWVVLASKDKALDLSKPPSECPDRQEMITLMGESWQVCNQKLLPIMRSASGKFLGFGEAQSSEAEVKGRFTGFLPERVPTAEDQQIAKEMLRGLTQEVDRGRDQERGWAR